MKSFYQALSGGGESFFLRHTIWISKALLKVSFFVRCAAQGKIRTIDNLIRRRKSLSIGIVGVNSVETVDHLLIHCPVVLELWALVFSWSGIQCTLPCVKKCHGTSNCLERC